MTAAEIPELAGIPWKRSGPRWGIWWIPDEAPGGLGHPELWMDEAALEMYVRGDAAPAVTADRKLARDGGVTWLHVIITFHWYEGIIPDQVPPVLYVVESRRTSPANGTRPYYVLKRPD